MTPAPAGHAAFEVHMMARWIAHELTLAAVDPDEDLTPAHRRALASLSVAVETQAARRTGRPSIAAEVAVKLAAALDPIAAA